MNRLENSVNDLIIQRLIDLDENAVFEIFKDLHEKQQNNNFQCVETPLNTVQEMCSVLPFKSKMKYLVFHAFEFVYYLIKEKKISCDDIVFIGDTKDECQIINNIFGCSTHSFLFSDFSEKEFQANFDQLKAIYNTMKFDVVIGNPPYQKPDGGNGASATPIYHKFVEKIIDEINPEHFVFIIPAKWYIGGKEPESFRKKMINDFHIKQIKDYQENKNIFPGVRIGGGVMWFHRDRNHNGPCGFNSYEYDLKKYKDVIIRYPEYHNLLDKILSKSNKFVSDHVFPRAPFGIKKNEIFDSENASNTIPCFFYKGKKHINRDRIKRGIDIIDKYKISTGLVYGGGNKRIIAKPWIMDPNEICSETYIVIFAHENEQIAKNFMIYSHTKFFAFLIMLKKITPMNTSKIFNFIPQMDYSKIWTDVDLYKYFNLTTSEIDMIEEAIAEYK